MRGLPDPRCRLVVLDGYLVDDVVDDRLRAPARPAAGADGGRRVRPGAAGSAAGVPPLLRADASAQPGRSEPARRGRAAVEPLAGDDLERRSARAPSWSIAATGRGACGRPCPRVAVDPGRNVIWDVARLDGPTRTDRSSCSSPPRRLGRRGSPGASDRVRRDRRLRRGGYMAWAEAGLPTAVGRRARRRRARRAPGGGWTGRARRHRRSAAVRVRVRPLAGRSRSARASCPTGWSTCRATARSPRSARVAIARAWPRRCSARPASSASPGCRAGCRPGRLGATRWPTDLMADPVRGRNRAIRRWAIQRSARTRTDPDPTSRAHRDPDFLPTPPSTGGWTLGRPPDATMLSCVVTPNSVRIWGVPSWP